jgi:quinol-cytochrome oxidoreductase complex cytochrome b subunit
MAGEYIGIVSIGLGLVFWTLIPFFDTDTTNGRRARAVSWAGFAVMAILIALTLLGYAEVVQAGTP